jgi:hypothetical protein
LNSPPHTKNQATLVFKKWGFGVTGGAQWHTKVKTLSDIGSVRFFAFPGSAGGLIASIPEGEDSQCWYDELPQFDDLRRDRR